jgi:hypothetical protein
LFLPTDFSGDYHGVVRYRSGKLEALPAPSEPFKQAGCRIVVQTVPDVSKK